MKNMKRFSLLLLAIIATLTTSASQFTSLSLYMTVSNGSETQELPPTGFPQNGVELEEPDNVFRINGFLTTTTGTVQSVVLKGTIYEKGSAPSEWMSVPGSKIAEGQWGLSGVDFDLLEGLEVGKAYTLELYVEGTDGDGAKFYYNNGGYNYKVTFRPAPEDPVSFLNDLTAGVELVMGDSPDLNETRWYYYDGQAHCLRDDQNLGKVSTLYIDGFMLKVKMLEGISSKDVSLQYKVHPEGEQSQWNRIDYQSMNYYAEDGVWQYEASNLNRDVLADLPSGNYVLEVMWQIVDNNGKYYFLNEKGKSEECRFHFIVGEGQQPGPRFTGVDVNVTFNDDTFSKSIPAADMPTIDAGNVSVFKLNGVDAQVLANGENITEVFMDYQIVDDKGNGPGWSSVQFTKRSETLWQLPAAIDVLRGLQNGKKYQLWFNFVARYGDNGKMFHYNNGNSMYRVEFTVSGAENLKGDVNGDGEVGIADVTMLSSLVLAQSENPRSDVNNDGETGIADITALVNILIKQ